MDEQSLERVREAVSEWAAGWEERAPRNNLMEELGKKAQEQGGWVGVFDGLARRPV